MLTRRTFLSFLPFLAAIPAALAAPSREVHTHDTLETLEPLDTVDTEIGGPEEPDAGRIVWDSTWDTPDPHLADPQRTRITDAYVRGYSTEMVKRVELRIAGLPARAGVRSHATLRSTPRG